MPKIYKQNQKRKPNNVREKSSGEMPYTAKIFQQKLEINS